MVTLERLRDLNGASSHGSCTSCGTLAEKDDSLIRIKASTDEKNYTSICLCGKCAEKLLKKLAYKY